MKKGPLIAAMILVTTAAQASTQILAECRGSIVKGSIGEIYTIELGGNQIAINSQYRNGFSITIPANSATVKANTDDKLVVNYKKSMFNKKSLVIDFKTGNGQASQYSAIDSLLKARVIYLTDCTN